MLVPTVLQQPRSTWKGFRRNRGMWRSKIHLSQLGCSQQDTDGKGIRSSSGRDWAVCSGWRLVQQFLSQGSGKAKSKYLHPAFSGRNGDLFFKWFGGDYFPAVVNQGGNVMETTGLQVIFLISVSSYWISFSATLIHWAVKWKFAKCCNSRHLRKQNKQTKRNHIDLSLQLLCILQA